jgi:uncharacterized protein YcbX
MALLKRCLRSVNDPSGAYLISGFLSFIHLCLVSSHFFFHRLVKMSPLFKRNLNPKYALNSDNFTDFSDDMPLLITTTASLHAVQCKSKVLLLYFKCKLLSIHSYRTVVGLQCDIDMKQFRPNIVLESQYSFEEIDWRALRVGSLDLSIAKRCTRCQVRIFL